MHLHLLSISCAILNDFFATSEKENQSSRSVQYLNTPLNCTFPGVDAVTVPFSYNCIGITQDKCIIQNSSVLLTFF